MNHLTVSTIIPTFNRAHQVARAINSVLKEHGPSDEVIVVDDGSTDHTEAVVAQFGSAVRYIRTVNRGAGAARNLGIGQARNDLVAFLDSDDEWMPGKLRIQRELMRSHPGILFCFTNLAYLSPEGAICHSALDNWHRDPRPWDEILGPAQNLTTLSDPPSEQRTLKFYVGSLYLAELQASYVSAVTLIVRRQEAGMALRFAEDVRVYEDWECAGRLAGAGPGAYVECETVWQHGHSGPRLTDADELACARARSAIIRRVWGTDTAFLREHGDLYHRVLTEQELRAVRALLAQARTAEAREILRTIDKAPATYRVLAALPGPCVRGVMSVRRAVRGLRARPS